MGTVYNPGDQLSFREDRVVSSGWNLSEALLILKGKIDPYLWEQGEELFRRNAVEDFAVQADGTIQVRVLDPRDARTFFVAIKKQDNGEVVVQCPCPYRLRGYCRHQVVALEYLRSVADGDITEEETESQKRTESGGGPLRVRVDTGEGEGSVLYRLFDQAIEVTTQPDGSLLRVVLQTLGSGNSPHRISLQLYSGTGWTELRTAEVERWIGRGARGAHPRDALLATHLVDDGELRAEIDSERLAAILSVVASTEALVDRMGHRIDVSPWPWRLESRLVRGREQGVGVELRCSDTDGKSCGFDDVSILPSVAPWIQLEDGSFHPLLAGVSGPFLERLQEEDLGEIPADELDRFLQEGVEELQRLCRGAFETEPGLIRDVEGVDGARLRLQGTPERLAGKLELSYGGEWVLAPDTPRPWSIERDGNIHRFPPAGQSLARARREISASGFRQEDDQWVLQGPGVLARALESRPGAFVSFELPGELVKFDLVERAPSLRLHIGGSGKGSVAGEDRVPEDQGVAPVSQAFHGGGGGSGISWFETTYELADGDRTLDVNLDRLRAAIDDDPGGLLQLDDGTVLSLKHDSIRTLADLAKSAAPEADETLRLSLAEVSELLDEPPGPLEFEAGIRGLLESLERNATLPPPELRDGLAEILRGYQVEAVSWFQNLGRWGLGGILADEMGLGKTAMALSHLFGGRGERIDGAPVLVVCPTSLVFNWLDECRKFCPHVRAVGLHGQTAARREELLLEPADLLVTSFALLRRDREALESLEFRAVLLDEGQHIKNATSQTAQAAFALRAHERWVLTGTPVENHLGELWSLFHFLMPGFLGGRSEFHERFGEPIRRGESAALSKLRSRVRPFLLRRTKEQVLSELPPRIEQIERVAMTDDQRRVYEGYLSKARGELEDELGSDDSGKARFKVLAALTRLRQICCHPSLVLERKEESSGSDGAPGDDTALSSGKFELVMELLQECVEEGHRVLLFSQFTSMLDIIEARLEADGIRFCRLDGSTRDREGEIRRFQRDDGIPVFLISLKAGGYGLNLTQADTVIIYDPWWNPATEDQAAARAHRMGQSLPVHVHKLITAGTVEEQIVDLQASKRDLAESIVQSEEDALGSLSLTDLKSLLYG